jgi:hypothetical protein
MWTYEYSNVCDALGVLGLNGVSREQKKCNCKHGGEV